MKKEQSNRVYVNDIGILNALGEGQNQVFSGLMSGSRDGLVPRQTLHGRFTVGECVPTHPETLEEFFMCRLNSLQAAACRQIGPTVEMLKSRYSAERIAVVLGSTDNGAEESMDALRYKSKFGTFPNGYTLEKQSAHHCSRFVKSYLGLQSLSATVSTACTSSSRAMILASDMIRSGLCDVAVCGGADIVSDSVLFGFHSLEAVDREPCLPFSANRNGINLGEGAALFVISKENISGNDAFLAGWGDSSDAYHMTGPDPEGKGAVEAMNKALLDAGIPAEAIDYVNLHGTGTELNDRMEAKAMDSVFPNGVPCSSTKALVGHTLGAAGATELGVCWLALSDLNSENLLPPHIWDGIPEKEAPVLSFTGKGGTASPIRYCMSNSFAFGGSNVSLIIGREVD